MMREKFVVLRRCECGGLNSLTNARSMHERASFGGLPSLRGYFSTLHVNDSHLGKLHRRLSERSDAGHDGLAR